MKPFRIHPALALLLLALAAGCSPALATEVSQQVEKFFPSFVEPTRTPFQPLRPTPSPTIPPTATPEPAREMLVWLEPGLPQALLDGLRLPPEAKQAPAVEISNLQIGAIRGSPELRSNWVYALAAPFPTLRDETSLEEIQRAWRGEPGSDFDGPLFVSPSTRAAFEALWGPPGDGRLRVLPEAGLLDAAWEERAAWALLPFERIEPRWKVLRVDGRSPLDPGLSPDDYPLLVWYGVTGQPDALALLAERMPPAARLLPAGNRDPGRLTGLVMTGVTALARATGYKMDTLGTTYPGQDIRAWLLEADIAHISNEVSFNEDCPLANFFSTSTMFCSRPEYIELLDYLGADLVELSGNHNNDWGRAAFTYSLELYQERGWQTFAGGADLAEARQPARFEHNGNRLAFIGCNPVGPPGVWATEDQPGAAACDDYAWMLDEIRRLREEGYLPIATFQYFELYIHQPADHQQRNFRAAIDAGAVIVSGSQAHFPQTMEFYNGGFIHFGLGNLFFDQMDIPVPGTRREFVDRHYFYDGRHIQTELLTALLEDYARPRPMDPAEREAFLSDIFNAAGW
jgi:poly-gamma-glutamate synthesis protein (capsule biosynthesis protein)